MINNLNNFKRYNTVFSLILIDIDFFKKFNDTYGHQSGDCVLKQVANILKRNSRTSDIVCRYGGEEMSIILTNTNKTYHSSWANYSIVTTLCQAVLQIVSHKKFSIFPFKTIDKFIFLYYTIIT